MECNCFTIRNRSWAKKRRIESIGLHSVNNWHITVVRLDTNHEGVGRSILISHKNTKARRVFYRKTSVLWIHSCLCVFAPLCEIKKMRHNTKGLPYKLTNTQALKAREQVVLRDPVAGTI